MQNYLFHGDHLSASRSELLLQVEKEKSAGRQILNLDGQNLTLPELEVALSTQNLFHPESLVIENLFSRLRSKERDNCLALISHYKGVKNLLLWEKKEITKTQLKSFPHLLVKLSKTPVVIFQLLDSLKPNNGRQSLELLRRTASLTDEGFIYIMISRRVSEMIIAKSGETDKISPWLKSRLLSQAAPWDESNLLSLHRQLHSFDYRLKTGRTKLSYLDTLDITLASLIS